jgi:hypothetical protein
MFVLVGTILLSGTARFAVMNLQRAQYDADYARAIDLADAGANYELNRISLSTANAHQSPGTTINPGWGPARSFKVWCTRRQANGTETTPWTAPNDLYIHAIGTSGSVSRHVRIAARSLAAQHGNYAIYTMAGVSTWHGSSMSINGDVGSNGQFAFSGHPGVTGGICFNGPSAGWSGGAGTGYTVTTSSTAIEWPTVAEKAAAYGGLAYLKTHNDNAMAVPPITGYSITGNVTLKGPGNYYIETLSLNGQKAITFDNTNGPVNVWIGPEGGTQAAARLRGGSAAVTLPSDYDPATAPVDRRCTIYVGTRNGIDIAGNNQLDCSIYAYNKDANGSVYGYVQNSGNPTVNGQILAGQADINGNLTINYRKTQIPPATAAWYTFDNQWIEISPR